MSGISMAVKRGGWCGTSCLQTLSLIRGSASYWSHRCRFPIWSLNLILSLGHGGGGCGASVMNSRLLLILSTGGRGMCLSSIRVVEMGGGGRGTCLRRTPPREEETDGGCIFTFIFKPTLDLPPSLDNLFLLRLVHVNFNILPHPL